MAKKMKKIGAFLLALVMCMSMFVTSAFALQKSVPIDKTANGLDANDQTDVTLSVPGNAKIEGADIVFVVDKSSCGKYATAQFKEMFNELAAAQAQSGATIKVGLVQFNYTDHLDIPLTELTADNVDELLGMIGTYSGGTNIESGLLVAKEMLDADQDVLAENKHVILISDGLTWVYDDEDGVATTILLELNGVVYSGTQGYISTRKADSHHIPAGYTWDTYWAQIKEWVKADGNAFDYNIPDYDLNKTEAWKAKLQAEGKDVALTSEEGKDHAVNMDRAMYDAWLAYTALQDAGYKCYVNNVATDTAQNGYNFMNMLAGDQKAVDFESIKDQILYTTAIGSTVEDFIGKNENGNFEFIEDAACITLNVGGKDYITTKTSDTEEGSSYAFAASADAEPTFWLDYTYGDGETTEKFIWTFGENVSMANIAKLTYKLQLTEKQDAAGTYTVPTNNSATLYPVDSEGNDGTPEVFPVPEVTYDVAAPRGNIVVAKVDENGNAVTGASFELFDAEGKSLGEYEVDSNGKITFEGLTAGSYKLVETVTPDGYIGISEPIYFEVIRTAEGEFEAKDAYELEFPGTAYEISNHSFYPAIPQTFVLLDAEDAKDWKYSEDADFQVVYCGDSETPCHDGVKYFRTTLEELYGENAGHIRAIVENSYPYVSMEDMIAAAVAAGVADAENLTRGDLIAAVQLAIWSYTNGGGYTYRATYSVNGRPEWGRVFNDYEAELPDSLPKGNTKTSINDAASSARIDALFNYLVNLPATEDTDEFEAFAYIAEGGKSASQTLIGADRVEFYTEGNVVFVENTTDLEDIEDPDVPLGPTPGGNENIEDEDVPKADVPKTGSMMMAAMSMAATSGAAAVLFRKKKD